jgi:aspartyl-tRNA synthetase
MLFTDQRSIREVILFPHLRSKDDAAAPAPPSQSAAMSASLADTNSPEALDVPGKDRV